MKKTNLLLIDNIFTTYPNALSENTIKKYLGLDAIKDQELTTLNRLCFSLKTKTHDHHIFENYYLNYQIPQIGKEFDLLRIGDDVVINIELKSQKVSDSEILAQLERNYYYLSFLNKEIFCFSFVIDGDKNLLYHYNKDTGHIYNIKDIQILIDIIEDIKDIDLDSIDNLFKPSDYLISPFNTTEEFIKDEYFLTKQQEQIKQEIVKKINNNNSNKIFSISGSAGTGKTLLTYDIAKELHKVGKTVTIIHCAQFNEGILKLRAQGWNIVTIRNYNTDITSSSNILIFDESQRISRHQLNTIITSEKKYIIFSHDVNQKLNRTNQAEEVVEHIQNLSGQNNYKLSKKIRHNKNLASFLKKLYNLRQINSDNLSQSDYDDISFYFTKDIVDAERYIEHLKSLSWEHIYLSNSLRRPDPLDKFQFSSHNSSHKVIGQEYDNVVIVINEHFFYTDEGKLSYNASYYYNPLETLFQAITRTRKKLTFVIIDNEEIYKKCIQIVNRS